MDKKNLGITCDHAGFPLKEYLKKVFPEIAHDYGATSSDPVDYPDHVHPACKALAGKWVDFEILILICGSANGVAMTANKYAHVRAAVCWNPEIAKLAREHNDANVLCIPSRFVTEEEAVLIVRAFIKTSFEGGRHQNRVNKIHQCTAI